LNETLAFIFDFLEFDEIEDEDGSFYGQPRKTLVKVECLGRRGNAVWERIFGLGYYVSDTLDKSYDGEISNSSGIKH
jgi:hypothetical protein